MKWVLLPALMGTATLWLYAAPTKKASHSSVSASSSSSSCKSHATSRTGHGHRARVHQAPAPSYQLHPDPERYQQIQQALTDRGYFNGPVNGEWGDDSTDALKRFQASQKLDPDGKINSLSLIDLGLGPKHDGGSVTSPVVSGSGRAAVSGSPPR